MGDDFSWVKWQGGFPAKRNHFMAGLQLQHDQIEATLLRACLEQVATNRGLSREQSASLHAFLGKVAVGSTASEAPLAESAASSAANLLRLLSQQIGPVQHVYAEKGASSSEVSPDVDKDIATQAAALRAHLQPT